MESTRKMDRQIKLGELIGFGITILAIVIGSYVSIRVHISTLELQVVNIKEQRQEDLKNREKTDEKVNEKLDKVIEGMNEIKVQLQNKEDKK